LGTSVAPFAVLDPTKVPNNVGLPPGIAANRFTRRHDLLRDLEIDFAETDGKARVQNHQILYDNAKRMVLSPRLKAFDLSQEKDSVRDRYGRTDFGQGCLLARRLVEQGVTFVEVESLGWDTHQDNFSRVKTLAGGVDPAFATLVAIIIRCRSTSRWPAVAFEAARSSVPRRTMVRKSINARSRFPIYSAPSAAL
jgi:hypothetical protein